MRKQVCEMCQAGYVRKVRAFDMDVLRCEDCGHEKIL